MVPAVRPPCADAELVHEYASRDVAKNLDRKAFQVLSADAEARRARLAPPSSKVEAGSSSASGGGGSVGNGSSSKHASKKKASPSTTSAHAADGASPPAAADEVDASSTARSEPPLTATRCSEMLADPRHLFRRMWAARGWARHLSGEPACWERRRDAPAMPQPGLQFFQEAVRGTHCASTN